MVIWKREISWLVVLILFSAAGCTSRNDEIAAPSATPVQPVAQAKVSILISDHSQSVPTGPVMNDPTFQYLSQKTGIHFSVDFEPHTKYNSLLKINFAKGSIADVVQDWRVNPELYTNGRLIPLNDLIDRYGPNLKRVIPQEAWEAVTMGGQIYGIPEAAPGNAPSSRVIYVRKDWMDKVGIQEAPKTPEQFLDMLRAFRDKDPNGNNQRDEIPFSSRANLNWSENLMGMFGVTPSGNHLMNDEVIPDIIHPAMKDALAFFRILVREKLIDSEFLSLERNVWEQKIQSNLVGSWNHVTELAWDWQNRLDLSMPGQGAAVIAIPTPRAPGVQEVGMEMNAVKKVFNITTSAQNPEAIIKMFDWLVSGEGQEFVNFGIPGVTYTKQGGYIYYDKQKDLANKTSTWRVMLLNLAGYNKELLTVQLGTQAVEKLDATYAIARMEGIPNPLTGMPALKSELKYPDLGRYGSMFVRAAAKIMLGEEPIQYFDEFVQNWREQGGDEIVKEMTEWYRANKK